MQNCEEKQKKYICFISGYCHCIKKRNSKTELRLNAPSGTRTRDTLIKSQVLYQLS